MRKITCCLYNITLCLSVCYSRLTDTITISTRSIRAVTLMMAANTRHRQRPVEGAATNLGTDESNTHTWFEMFEIAGVSDVTNDLVTNQINV